MKIIDVIDAYNIDFESRLFYLGQENPKAKMEEFSAENRHEETRVYVVYKGKLDTKKLEKTMKKKYGLILTGE